jgi:lipase
MVPFEEPFLPSQKFEIPVPGGDISLFRYGTDIGNPTLLIHGVTSSNRAFQLFAQALIARGRTPYAVDLRGRGDSSSLPGPFGMRVHASDLAKVVKNRAWDAVDVIGHSMGAFVTVAFTGLYPELVSRIVLADGGIPLPLPPGYTIEQVMPLILGPALARLQMEFSTITEYRDYWKPQPAFAKGWSATLDEYVDYDLRGTAPRMHASTNPASVEEDSRDLFGTDLIENTLRNLSQETLFIKAERGLQNEPGGLYPLPILENVLPHYPKLILKILEDTNHYDMFLESNGAESIAQLVYGGRI